MADNVINFRQAKKQLDRAKRERVAAENRAKYGRRQQDRKRQTVEADRLGKQLDGARREPAHDAD